MFQKIVLIGDESSGKTELFKRLILSTENHTFNEQIQPTIGATYDTMGALRVWDTQGQESLSAFTPIYIQDAAIVLICVDLSQPFDRPSLDAHYEHAKKHAPEAHIQIVGTKADLVSPKVANQFQKPFSELAPYLFCSSKRGTNLVAIKEVLNACLNLETDNRYCMWTQIEERPPESCAAPVVQGDERVSDEASDDEGELELEHMAVFARVPL